MTFSHRQQHLSLPEEHRRECTRIVRRFFPTLSSHVQIQGGGSGFSGARIFRVTTPDSEYALRRWPNPTLPKARLQELHRYLNHLVNFNLPVAAVLRDPISNNSLIELNHHLWQLEPWLPGTPRTGTSISRAEVESSMQALAELHLASSQYNSTPAGSEWFSVKNGMNPTIVERIRLIQNWSPAQLQAAQVALQRAPTVLHTLCSSILEKFRQHATSCLKLLEQYRDQSVFLFPCWRDLWADHVLFMNQTVTGLLDPNATRSDHVATDLSRLLGSYFGDDQQSWEGALNAYEDVRSLTRQDRELVDLFDKSAVLLSGLTWIQRWQHQTIHADQLDQVVNRLRIIEGRMQNL